MQSSLSQFLWLFGSGISVSVHTQCECAYTMRVGMVLVVRPYVHHNIYITSDKHTSACEAKQISPPKLSEEARFARQLS